MTLPIPLHLLVLIPMIAGAAGYFLPQRAYHRLLLLVNVAVVAVALSIFRDVRWGSAIVQRVADWPDWIAITLVADLYSAPLVLLTALFFAGTFLFSTRADYLDKTFLFLFVLLESSLIAIFLSGDLFNIYVLIELGMLIIAILIMYKQDKQSVYDAMLYLMMNFIGMAFMLLGIGYLYRMTGVLDLAGLQQRLPQLGNARAAIVPYALIMTSIAVKAALFPLFSWLPRAHGAPSAPSIVSAVLSGVQVKAGVYLLIRVSQTFSAVIDAAPFFMLLGFVTSVVGFLLAIAQKDIKLILAYHTVSQVGLIVMGLHLGSEVAFWGGMYHIINHALFKGLLFLTAGIIIEEYGSRSYAEIRGVLRHLPAVGIGTLAGVLGITGAPFFNGSISKYFIQQGLQGDLGGIGMFLINLGTTLSFVKYSVILFGTPNAPQPPQRDPWVACISLLFGLACLAGGLFGGPTVALVYGPQYSAAGALGLEKITSFVLTLAIAVGAYLLVVKRIGGLLLTVRSAKVSFNQITVLLTLFFVGLLGYTWWSV
ncbi:MAG: proton-conducting membrane transporter [Spirochaetaceae bacterium]|nr:MAG: proton-conducting membrane transporter [Spirochaetaceae bacterium]